MEIKKLITSDPNLLYLGTKDEEEYYQKTNEMKGWSFMGLRPDTEENLRRYAKETDPRDIGMKIPEQMERYFDFDQFSEDMEEDWYDRHDVQAERENEDKETLYLGFGSGTDATRFFETHNITDYESYIAWFDEIGLTKEEFDKFVTDYV